MPTTGQSRSLVRTLHERFSSDSDGRFYIPTQDAGHRDFVQGTLDSLSAQIAVLGPQGTVIATNLAWRRAGDQAGTTAAVGESYLARWDAPANDPRAVAVAAGLRSVLTGLRDCFEFEHDSPGAHRYFVSVTRYRGEGSTRAVIQRDDVTRKQDSGQNYLLAVTDSMGEGLFSVDDAGRLTYMNSVAEELLGWTASELLGRQMDDVIHQRRAGSSPCPAERVRVEDDFFVCKDGSKLPVAYTAAPFEADTGIRGAVVVFRDVSEQRAQQAKLDRDLEALNWIARIRDALENDRFVLHAQPIIDVASGEPVQHELLIRMLDETGALVMPDRFLPVAEEYGLIREIDRWVIQQAARIAADGHPVAVNLSAESLGDATLLAFVEGELARTGAVPTNLVFELTETGLLRDEQSARSFIEGVTALGSHVALDDFGTGYGGLMYVKRLPVDFLKIDVEFVRDLAQNSASHHVVRAVVHLARGFGHHTVAEGVEDHETLGLLRALGVDFAQGYGIGRPAPLDQMCSIHPQERQAETCALRDTGA
jgi:PAS domain S-box-containing protein